MSGEVRYERVGAAAVLTIDRPERRNAVDGADGRAAAPGPRATSRPTTGARVLVLTGAGGVAFCAGADLKAIGPRRRPSGRPDGLDAADAVEAGDRRDRRLVPGRRASSWRSGATCGSRPRAPPSASSSGAGACR